MHWAMQSIRRDNRRGLKAGLVLTILLGLAFLLTQMIEYAHVGFNTGDGAFASVFFGLTGLHGAHVFVGLSLLIFAADARLPRALLARPPPRRRDPRDLLALRRRDVDRRVHRRSTCSERACSAIRQRSLPKEETCRNPFRSRRTRFGSSARDRLLRADRRRVVRSRRWLGLVVFVVLTAVAVWLIRGGRREPPQRVHVEHAGAEDERRILVVANETVGGEELRELAQQRGCGEREEVLVVCPGAQLARPALGVGRGPRPRRRPGAARRVPRRASPSHGIQARGEIGDGDPLQAIEDALRTFGADEIVISTHPPGRSNWLEHGVVERRPRALRRAGHARRRRPEAQKRVRQSRCATRLEAAACQARVRRLAPATLETYVATASIWASLSCPLKAASRRCPFVTRSTTSAFVRLRLVEVRADRAGRAGVGERVAACRSRRDAKTCLARRPRLRTGGAGRRARGPAAAARSATPATLAT